MSQGYINRNSLYPTSGTGPFLLQTGPTTYQPNIVGVTDGSNAAAGSVGEYIESVILAGSGVSISDSVAADITSISLTAGDWDVNGSVSIANNTNGNVTDVGGWISLTSATLPDFALYNNVSMSTPPGAYFAQAGIEIPIMRVNVTITTTVYLSCLGRFAAGSSIACGKISARRRR